MRVGDDEHLARPRDVRRGERREATFRRAEPRVPALTDRGERPAERSLESMVASLGPGPRVESLVVLPA